MSVFKDATYKVLIEHKCPVSMAYLAADVLDRQNKGELPCPLPSGSYEQDIIDRTYQYIQPHLQANGNNHLLDTP